MNRQKRQTYTKSRQSKAAKRLGKRRGATRRRKASTRTRRAAPVTRATMAQKRAAQIFEEQIQDVWTRFGQECLQFAEGFNNEIGAHQLHVEVNSDTVVANFMMGGEVLVQLDRDHKHVGCFITSQCGAFGSCIVEQPPIGFSVEDDRLRWVYGARLMAEDDLAVKLMTELVQIDSSPKSAASQ
jgi:hypothetical protein